MAPNPDVGGSEKSKMPNSNCNTDLAAVQNLEVSRRDSIQSNASFKSRSSQVTRDPGPTPFEPPDGGYGWMVVVGAIMSGALIPSLFMCFGVFMNAFMVVFPNVSKSSAAWIPSLMSSLMNCMGPITSALVNLYSARLVSIIGGCVISTGLILSYFTNSVEALYFTYGILGGIGAGLAIAPGLYLISTYFKKRRGLATGICMAGSSIGQIVIPYLIQFLLDEYNYRGCILILGGLTLNVCVAGALYRPLQITPKLPKKPQRERTVSQSSRRSSMTFIPDEGICMTEDGSYAAMSKKNTHKCKDSKKKKHKKSKNNNNRNNKKTQGGASKTEIQAILIENTWNSINQNDNQAPTKSRSRTLSLDSSRILPDIPEEHEDDAEADGQTAIITKSPLVYESKEEPDTEVSTTENCTINDTSNGIYPIIGNSIDNGVNTVQVNDSSTTNGPSTINATDMTNGIDTINCAGITSCTNNATFSNNNTEVWKLREDLKKSDNVWVRLSYTDSDSDCANEQSEPPQPALEVVSLHQCYGSMASIASFGPSIEERGTRNKTSILQNISKFLGLSFFRESIFFIIAASFTCLVITLTSYTMFIPTYGTSIKLSADQSAGLISIIAFASMFGRLLLPTLSDFVKVKRKHIYLTCCAFISGSIILTIFANSYEVLLASIVMFGFSTGGAVSLSISVCLDYIAVEKFAALFGLVQLATGIAVLFANPLFGLLLDSTKSYSLMFCILCVSGSLSGLVLYLDRFSNYESVAPPGKYKIKLKK